MAARLDGEIELVAGCFSADPAKSKALRRRSCSSTRRAFTRPTRKWPGAEAALPADQRIDFVSIVTRNNPHFAVAKAFLRRASMSSATSRCASPSPRAGSCATIVRKIAA
jgi:predicted dehydrogenase